MRSDVDRAAVLLRLGVCRYKLSSISTALALLDDALDARRPLRPSVRPAARARSSAGAPAAAAASATGRRRARTSSGRSSSREAAGDREATANTYFQASLVAEREGHWLLARTYAERARGIYEEIEDRANVGRHAQQPRRAQLHARQPRACGRAAARTPSGSRRRRAARWTPGQALCSLARSAPGERRAGSGGGEGAQGARPPRRIASTTCTRSAPRSSLSAARCSSRIA